MAPGAGDASASGAATARLVRWESDVSDDTESGRSGSSGHPPRPHHSGREARGAELQEERNHAAAEQLLMTAETYSRLLRARDAELKHEQAKVTLYEKSMATARDALTTAKDEIETLRGQLGETQAAHAAREAEGKELSAAHKLRIDSCEAQIQSLKDLNATYLQDVKRLQHQCEEQQKDAQDREATARDALTTAKNQMETLRGQLGEAQAALAAREAEGKELSAAHKLRMDSCEAQIQSLKDLNATYLQDVKRLQHQCEEQQKDAQDREATDRNAQINYREHMAGVLEAKNQELADADARAKEKQDALNSLQTELQAVKAAAEAWNQERDAHRRELEHLAAAYQDANIAEVTEVSRKYLLEIEAREKIIREQAMQRRSKVFMCATVILRYSLLSSCNHRRLLVACERARNVLMVCAR